MHKRQKLLVSAVVFVTAMAVLVFGKIHVIREDSGGSMLWNSNEAYLFVNVHHRGFQVRYLEYPWLMLQELLYGVREPDVQHTSVVVIHVADSGFEHHVVEMLEEHPGNTPDLYTPLNDLIYANCGGYLCRWDGNKFETATHEEQHRFDGINNLGKGGVGWSTQGIGVSSGDYQIAGDVGGKFTVSITNQQLDRTGHSGISVNVVYPGSTPKPIWHFDGRPRRVSRAEYQHMFGQL